MKLFVVCLTLIFVCAALMLPVGANIVSYKTYEIQGQHSGIVYLQNNGNGIAISGNNQISFSWDCIQDKCKAHYWWWDIPFVTSGNTIESSVFPNDIGVLKN